MANSTVHDIPVDLIDPMQPNRKVDQRTAERIAQSMVANQGHFHGGQMQPVGVKTTGDRFQLTFGNHRLQAAKLAKRKTIAAYVLPEDCTAEQELAFSLQENHLRAQEDMESTLARVETYASYKRCSIAEAAKACGVNKSYVSKVRKINGQLGPDARAFAKDHKVGLSLLYLIAKTKSEKRQLELLKAYVDGRMDRDAVADAVKNRPTTPRNQTVSIDRVIEGIPITFIFPATANYEQLGVVLRFLTGEFKTHRKHGIPVALLAEVMAGAIA